MKSELGVKAMHRRIAETAGMRILREPRESYGTDFGSENDALRLDNAIFWNENAESAET
jgi:hypothetical protein